MFCWNQKFGRLFFFLRQFFIQSYQNVSRQVLNPFQIKIIPRLVHRAVRRRRQRTGVEF